MLLHAIADEIPMCLEIAEPRIIKCFPRMDSRTSYPRPGTVVLPGGYGGACVLPYMYLGSRAAQALLLSLSHSLHCAQDWFGNRAVCPSCRRACPLADFEQLGVNISTSDLQLTTLLCSHDLGCSLSWI